MGDWRGSATCQTISVVPSLSLMEDTARPVEVVARADYRFGDLFFDCFDHAAFAISATRSQVVAFMLGRASIRASQATRLLCGAPSTAHSGVWVKKPICGAT